jgi:hypothetical protein
MNRSPRHAAVLKHNIIMVEVLRLGTGRENGFTPGSSILIPTAYPDNDPHDAKARNGDYGVVFFDASGKSIERDIELSKS